MFFCKISDNLLKDKLRISSNKFYIYLKIFLFKNIKIYFLKKNNILFLQQNNLIIQLNLLKFFFLKNISKNINYKNFNFLFINLNNFKNFFIRFINIYSTFNYLYFFRLKLKGLGFVLKRHSKSLCSFLMAVNHFFYFFIPNFVLLKKKKKSIICLSLDLSRLNLLF